MAKKITDEDMKQLDELCSFSSPKLGRPLKWTEEAIQEFAEGLIKYSEKSSSLTVGAYATQFRYSPDILSLLAGKSEVFRRALITAKRTIGERRELGALTKKLDSKAYTVSARMYDSDLDHFLKDQLAQEELIKAKAKIKALKSELKNMGEIKEYIESQKIIESVEPQRLIENRD